MGLIKQAKNGFLWITLSQVFNRLSHIIFTAILARILLPEHFGIVSMAIVFSRMIRIFNGAGLSWAIIREKELSKELLSSAFSFNLLISLFLSIILASLAPFAAWFYNESELIPIVLIFATLLIVDSFASLHMGLLNKELLFKKIAIIESSALVVANLVGIAFALNGAGTFSLMARLAATAVCTSVLAWNFTGWFPKLRFKFNEVRPLFSFSSYYTFSKIFVFLIQNIDFIIIGKFFGATALGIYTIAFNLAVLPSEQVKVLFSKVLYPTYARLQDDLGKFRTTYYVNLWVLSSLLLPFLVIMAIFADSLIFTIYGENWTEAAQVLPFLTLMGIARGLLNLTNTTLLALGHSKSIFTIEVFQAVTLSILVGTAANFEDLRWIAFAYSFAQFITFIVYQINLNRKLNTNFHHILHAFRVPVVATIFTAVISKMSTGFFSRYQWSNIFELIISLMIAGCVYTGAFYLFAGRTEKKNLNLLGIGKYIPGWQV